MRSIFRFVTNTVGAMKNRHYKRFAARGDRREVWTRRYPDRPASVALFLDCIEHAFLPPRKIRHAVEPDDRMTDLYRAVVGRSVADSMELETFLCEIERRFSANIDEMINPDVTFADIFDRISRPSEESSS